MATTDSRDLTTLLTLTAQGSSAARAELYDAIAPELQRLASAKMRWERPGHTLQTAGLINEAYIRLFKNPEKLPPHSVEFYRAAANVMREILIDHARSKASRKRCEGMTVELLRILTGSKEQDALARLSALDGALNALSKCNASAFDVIQLRFFAGLSVETTAELLCLTVDQVKKRWATWRAWLRREVEKNTR